ILLHSLHDALPIFGSVLKALSLVGAASPRSRALVGGMGELWSARLLAATLARRLGDTRQVVFVDARKVLVIDTGEMGPIVVWDETRPKLAEILPESFSGIAVITGFIASDREGLPTTLGRNGSDYSASIFGALRSEEHT